MKMCGKITPAQQKYSVKNWCIIEFCIILLEVNESNADKFAGKFNSPGYQFLRLVAGMNKESHPSKNLFMNTIHLWGGGSISCS